MTEAGTIGEVLEVLDAIVERSRASESPAGYFAALYRLVTRDVRDGIARRAFDDPARMERLDVAFANRYLRAFGAYVRKRPTTASWAVAFRATEDWWPTVLQHLLLGMNAHINLDLGIAAAQVAPGDALADLEADFDRINALLAARVDRVQNDLSEIWPLFRLLDVGAGRTDEAVANFSIRRARAHAWSVAQRLAALDAEERAAAIEDIDGVVALIGGAVRRPGLWLGSKLRLVRLGELGSVRRKIGLLE